MMKAVVLTICAVFLVTTGSAVAQMGMGHKMDTSKTTESEDMSDMKKMGHEMMDHHKSKKAKSAMDHSEHMRGMHEKLAKLHEHSKKIAEVEDSTALAVEMKNHMRMTDEIIQQLVDAMMSKRM